MSTTIIRTMALTSLVALAAALPGRVCAQATAAPVFSTKGFSIGIGLNGSSVNIDDDLGDGNESGGGLGLWAAYGFTPRLSLFLEGTAASMSSEGESWILSHGDIGVRYAFTAPSRRFVPFLEGAFSTFMGTQEDIEIIEDDIITTGDLELSGTGLTLGAGFNYYFNPRLAFTTSLKFTRGEFDTVKFENVSIDGLDVDATSTRLTLGVTWFPRGGR